MSNFIYPPIAITISGGATAAKQDEIIALETAILADTTSLDTKTVKSDTDNVTVVSSTLPAGAATETTAANILTDTSSIDTKTVKSDTDNVTIVGSSLPTGASTETTSAAILADTASLDGKVTACDTGAVVVASSALPAGAATETTSAAILADTASLDTKTVKSDTDNVTIVSSTLPTGAATEATAAAILADTAELNARLAGNLVPELFDYLALTYVAAGAGEGEIETVVYKTGGSGGSTVATLTLGYDASDRLNSVTRS